MTQITIPLPESLVLAIGVLLAFGLASALVVFAMMPAKAKPKEAIASFQSQMGLDRVPPAVFFLMVTSWGAIFLVLLVGILITIFDTLWRATPGMLADDSAAKWDWRFSIAKLTALTAVLGAVVALPFTVIRLKLSREQTETAQKQTDIAQRMLEKEKASLVNDKMNAAVSDLYAQRQITKWNSDTNCHEDTWEDDITRRNGAIDRLRGLVEEEPELLPRVDRMLTVYLQELTRQYPPKEPPEKASVEKLRDWAKDLKPPRSDMENAVKALARLKRPPFSKGASRGPDLEEINMQGFNLSQLVLSTADLFNAFLQGANLSFSQLQDTILSNAQLQGSDLYFAELQGATLSGTRLQGADLTRAEMQGAELAWTEFDRRTDFSDINLSGAALREIDFSDAPQIEPFLQEAFGDASVTLPPNVSRPAHWSNEELNYQDFETQWRDFQHSIGQDPDDPE